MRKTSLLIVLLLLMSFLGAGLFVYRGFIKEKPVDFVLEKIVRGEISQEISETGVVRAGQEINLSFKNIGRIKAIYVGVGDIVEPGQSLAELDATQLFIQLDEAKAVLEMAETKLSRLLAGASEEEIRIAQTAVDNLESHLAKIEKSNAQNITGAKAQISSAQVSLQGAEQRLIDAQAKAKRELAQAYEGGLNVLESVFLQVDNAFNVVDSVQRTYFHINDQESIRVRENKTTIKNARDRVKSFLEIAKSGLKTENIDKAILEAKNALGIVSGALTVIRDVCETPFYRHLISKTDKASLDAQRTSIASALTNIINAQQAIFSAQLIGQTNINIAKASFASAESALALTQENLAAVEAKAVLQSTQAEGQLKTAQDQLALIKVEPRPVDIAFHQAQISQAQARKTLLEEQIQESVLKSPVRGKITNLIKRTGETVQPIEPIVSLLPENPFQVEVGIYEQDIVGVGLGNPVDIVLVAFPDKVFAGEVISIDPTEKLIGGVVYYKATIDFKEETPAGLKPGMTADIVIKTVFKENVLIISNDAIHPVRNRISNGVQEKNGKFIVQVFKDGLIQDRVIEIGLKGDDDMVEVVSGLEEGEEVVVQ